MKIGEETRETEVTASGEPVQGVIKKEAYLATLNETDRSNLAKLSERFGQVLREEGRQGILVATGSTVTGERRLKPTPVEQDIDLTAIFQFLPGEPEPDYYLEAQLKAFKVFQTLMRKVIARDSGFIIDSLISPFASPSGYMRHTGSITVRAIDGGMPIELSLVNRPFENIQDPIFRDTSYSIILDVRGDKERPKL